jgi:hypothetical protein
MSYRLQALLHVIEQHVHAVDKVYPVAADPVTLTADSSATGWLEGAKTEVVPASTITEAFDITGMWVTADTADDYEIVIYVGAAGSEIEIARVAYTQTSATNSSHIPCSTPICAADERISASVVSASNGGEEVYLKLQYHEHDLDE